MRSLVVIPVLFLFACADHADRPGNPVPSPTSDEAPVSDLPAPVPSSCAPRPGIYVARWLRTSGTCGAEVSDFVEVTDYAHAAPAMARNVTVAPVGWCEADATYSLVWETGGTAHVAEHVVWQFDGLGGDGEATVRVEGDGACEATYDVTIGPVEG